MLLAGVRSSIFVEESMAHPQTPDHPMPGDVVSLIRLTIPPDIRVPESWHLYQVLSPERLDHRLKGYGIAVLLSEPDADDPSQSSVPRIPLHGQPVDGWQLWRAWLKRPGGAVTAELRYEPVYGWGAAIYHWQAPLPEVTRIAHALDVLQRLAPAPGRPKGTRDERFGPFPDAKSFLNAALRARDAHRQQESEFTQESLARELGMTEDSFKRNLRKCQPKLKWGSFLSLP
jgi:hypothetical protein